VIHTLVLGVVFLVALFDAVVGAYLLVAREPYRVNGAEALWARESPRWYGGEAGPLLRSLYRRLGAFSFHTGVATAVWAWLGRDDALVLGALLVTYTVTGLGFFANDRAYFRGTRYFVVKQALGALWAAAVAGHLATTL
jgi:hypothetical protein